MSSSPKFRALWLAAIVTVPTLVGLIGAAPAGAAGNEQLTDGGTYWQGEILTAGNAAAPGEKLQVNSTETGKTELSVTANSEGDITVDTSTLPAGVYNLTNSTGATLFEFEIVLQDLSVSYEGLHLAYGGELKKAVIALDSNRGTFEVNLSSSAWNSSRTVEAHGGENLTINASTLPDGPHIINGYVLDTTASFTVTVDVSNPPSIEYVFPDREGELDLPNDTRPFVDGESYWQGENAVWDSETPGLTYQIRDSGGSLIRERSTNSTGHAIIDTAGLEGTYDLINTSSGKTVGTFTVKVQTVSVDVTTGSQELTQGETTKLTISTDLNGSDFALWSDKLTRNELNRAFPDAEHIDREVLLRNVSDGDQFRLETGHLDPGTYQVGVWSTKTGTQDRLTLIIEAKQTESSSVSSTGGTTGSSSTTATTTSTRQSTATVTTSSPHTPEPTPRATSNPRTVTVVKTVVRTVTVTPESSDGAVNDLQETEANTLTADSTDAPGQSGFGIAVALLAVLMLMALVLRRRA